MRLFALAILCATLATGQALDKGKPFLDKTIAALGGENFLHMRTRFEHGRVYSFFHDQISGFDIANIYIEYLPEKPAGGLALRQRQVFGKKQDYSLLFLPDQAWDVTYRGARPIPDENWQKYLQTTETDILYFLRCRYSEPGLVFDYLGTDVLNNKQVEVVEITDAKRRTIRVYLDHITMLPVRQTYRWFDPDNKYHNDEITDFDKYRDAGNGVMWPFSVHRERNGYKTYEIFADKAEVNQPLPDQIFDLPPGAKVLKKVD